MCRAVAAQPPRDIHNNLPVVFRFLALPKEDLGWQVGVQKFV